MITADGMTAQEMVERIGELSQELFTSNRYLVPKAPWVAVMLLPKERMAKGLYLPEGQQKPVHEGIVLATWRPYTKDIGARVVDGNGLVGNGTTIVRTVEMKSDLEIGDHVIFAHWSGLPIGGLFDAEKFRLVREFDENNAQGGILAKIEYDDLHASKILRDILANTIVGAADGIEAEALASLMAARVEERLLLLDRASQSVLLSGR